MEHEVVAQISHVDPDLDVLIVRLERFFAEHALPHTLLHSMCLVLDEVVCNIVSYGQARNPIAVRLWLVPDEVCAEVVDDGIRFDPLVTPDPDVTSDIDSRKVGGLGIFLIRKLMDRVSYERRDDHNRLSFAKRIASHSADVKPNKE